MQRACRYAVPICARAATTSSVRQGPNAPVGGTEVAVVTKARRLDMHVPVGQGAWRGRFRPYSNSHSAVCIVFNYINESDRNDGTEDERAPDMGAPRPRRVKKESAEQERSGSQSRNQSRAHEPSAAAFSPRPKPELGPKFGGSIICNFAFFLSISFYK